jgi:hypothetical protein
LTGIIRKKWIPVLQSDYAQNIDSEDFLRQTGFSFAENAPECVSLLARLG